MQFPLVPCRTPADWPVSRLSPSCAHSRSREHKFRGSRRHRLDVVYRAHTIKATGADVLSGIVRDGLSSAYAGDSARPVWLNAMWLAFGIMFGSWLIIVANAMAIALALSGTVLRSKMLHR